MTNADVLKPLFWVGSALEDTMSRRSQVRKGSGNVFVDLSVPGASEALAKAEIARRIIEILDGRRLTQMAAAQALGIDQPKISALKRGRLEGFSTERLFKFLNALGRDIEIVIKKKSNTARAARIRVSGGRN